ncbi:MAG: hypothetical protein V1859_07555 [archaeon]
MSFLATSESWKEATSRLDEIIIADSSVIEPLFPAKEEGRVQDLRLEDTIAIEENDPVIETLVGYNRSVALDRYFLSYLIPYVAKIYTNLMRDTKKKNSFSHPNYMAGMAMSMGLSARTVYQCYVHDAAEEVCDWLLDKYGRSIISDSQRLHSNELLAEIDSVISVTPEVSGMPDEQRRKLKKLKTRRAKEARTDLKGYNSFKTKVAGLLGHHITQFDKNESFSNPQYSLQALTRTPGERYGAEIARVFSVFVDEQIQISNIETKLLDGLHNVNDMGRVVFNGEEDGLDFDIRIKSLLKKIYVINKTRKFLLDKTHNGRLDDKYYGIYCLHMRLANDTAREARKVTEALEIRYNNHRKRYFDRAKRARDDYVSRGYINRLTNPKCSYERKFKEQHHGIYFGGTLESIRRLVDHEREDRYENLKDNRRINQCYRDNLMMEALATQFFTNPLFHIEGLDYVPKGRHYKRR